MSTHKLNSKMSLIAVFVFFFAILQAVSRGPAFGHLWSDPAMLSYPGVFPGEELLNRIAAIVQICIVMPLLLIASIGLFVHKSWGHWQRC